MDLQPHLNGRLLSLRPLVNSDFEALYEAASNASIWEQHQNKDRHTHEGFTLFFNDAMASGGAFCILDNKNENVIGSSRFKIIDQADSIIEIGWTFLKRAYWGGSYNREVKELMINYALKYYKKVVFYVDEKNCRSQKALEKIGAVRTIEYDRPWVLKPSDGLTYLVSETMK